MKRQPDGRWRNRRQTMVITAAVLRARWIEAEALRLKVMGLSFQAIADHISRVGRGQTQPLTELPKAVTFPPDYEISRQACYKAVWKSLNREPALRAEQLRKIHNARSEEMFANLQPDIRKGKVPAIVAGVRVLDLSARINNIAGSARSHEAINEESRSRLESVDVVGTFAKAFKVLDEIRGVRNQEQVTPLIEAGDPSSDRHVPRELRKNKKTNEE
jgi:hypothetical protein